ncbi:MAG TPA: hypothetical protein PK280_00135 [Planctomycetota bacterium]|nr:hypothetical protein [Planctomycetota bacterium]
MAPIARGTLRRDVVRMAWQTGLLLGLLGSVYAGVKHRGMFRAFYCAGRLVNASWVTAPDWAGKLADIGPQAAPACRLAYRLAGEDRTKEWAARSLGRCAGLAALHRLVEQEGPASPAESGLVAVLIDVIPGAPDPDLLVSESDLDPPKEPLQIGPNQKTALRASIGDYEVVIEYEWFNAEWWRRSADGKVTSGQDLHLDASTVTVIRRNRDAPGGVRLAAESFCLR